MNREGTPLPVFRVVMNRPCRAANAVRARIQYGVRAGLDALRSRPPSIPKAVLCTYPPPPVQGKTAVLTRRIIEKIRRGGDVRRLLVVTFTVSAAGEMRTRIPRRPAKGARRKPRLPSSAGSRVP